MIVLDKLVSEYLTKNPGAIVVNIAHGLDTRCYRMTGFKHWYNLDLLSHAPQCSTIPKCITVHALF